MENTNTNTVGAVETTETTEKTYTQSELDSIVQAEADRRVTQALDKYTMNSNFFNHYTSGTADF